MTETVGSRLRLPSARSAPRRPFRPRGCFMRLFAILSVIFWSGFVPTVPALASEERGTRDPAVMARVDPPRNLPAIRWNGSFCSAWTDGCTDCRRVGADGQPQCGRRPDAEPHCAPAYVFCTSIDGRTFPERPRERCSAAVYHRVSVNKDGTFASCFSWSFVVTFDRAKRLWRQDTEDQGGPCEFEQDSQSYVLQTYERDRSHPILERFRRGRLPGGITNFACLGVSLSD
jgi:hypothetical protein